MFLFGTAAQRPKPVSQYVVNEGRDSKLNSMDSVLVDIENVVIMCEPFSQAHRSGLCETRPALICFSVY